MARVDAIGVPIAKLQDKAQSPGFAFFPVLKEMSAFTLTGTTVTAHATPHTAGSWVELIAATTLPASWVLVQINGMAVTNTDTRGLVDIGFGAAAAEVAMISSLPAGASFINGTSGAAPTPATMAIPINVPVGTRISARLQALITVDVCDVAVATAAGTPVSGIGSPRTVDTIGADTANSKGTNLPTTNTYAQITAATTQAYRALVMMPCAGTGSSYSGETSVYTLAVGGSGSEVAIGTAVTRSGPSEIFVPNIFGIPAVCPGHFPTGTRIACKQSIGVTYRDVIVLGIPYT